jgi:hypothetical protein
VLGAVGAVLAAAIVVAVVIVTATPGSSRGAGSPSAASGSVSVQRRDLVATDTESGTLSYAKPQTVFNRMSGTITWLPAVGQIIRPGQTLYDVDNQPVVLLNGTTPAFRSLSGADSPGPDILELNRNLHALGFDAGEPVALTNAWQTATTDALERWQGSLGQTETGAITLGQVVFLPGTQRITAIDTVLGSTGGSGASGAGSSSAGSGSSATGASTAVVARPEFVSLSTTTSVTGPTGPTGQTGHRGPGGGSPSSGVSVTSLAEIKALTALLKVETAELRSARSSSTSASSRGSASTSSRSSTGTITAARGSSGSSAPSASGSASASGGTSSGGGTAQAIMSTSSTQLVVTVDLDASKQSEAVVGEPVTVEMPDQVTVDGRITAVSPVAQASSSSSSTAAGGGSSSSGGSSASSSATIPVTVTLSGHLATGGLDQAAVSVNFEQQVENNVLSVPVTALLATQGGGYAVQEAAAPHRLLPVTPGLFAAGYVEVSGARIYSGLQVTDSQG